MMVHFDSARNRRATLANDIYILCLFRYIQQLRLAEALKQTVRFTKCEGRSMYDIALTFR